jgi:hypothetical protein
VKRAGPGFASSDLLVRSGFATVTAQRVKAGGEVMCSPRCGSLTRGAEGAGRYMTIREEIMFSVFVAAAMVLGWRLVLSTLDYVLG